jgi:mannose-6-phosphate isomerase
MIPLYPLLLRPALHVKVWGGRRLQTLLNKDLPTDEPYGESWEMHDTATVATGALSGRSLGDLLKEYGHALVGADNDPAEGFPLLAKFLDANDWLSVQVHPNDEQARELEGEPRGKTEAWYFFATDPGARIVKGMLTGTTREGMAQAIRENTLEALLAYGAVNPGDVLVNLAGGIHALGPGIIIYEIQQSSDITYRLYDWGRMDLNGKPRTLHIEKGVAVSNLDSLPPIVPTADNQLPIVDLVRTPFFNTLLHQLTPRNGMRISLDTAGRHFHILTSIGGSAVLRAGDYSVTLGMGQTALIPACIGVYTLEGEARILRSFQP